MRIKRTERRDRIQFRKSEWILTRSGQRLRFAMKESKFFVARNLIPGEQQSLDEDEFVDVKAMN